MKRTHGFTRTEMTVVLGGAAILAATIFPLAVRAQNAAQMSDPMATCQSNLKQVGLGILQYVQDYDEKYPMATYANNRTSWRSAIEPYIASVNVFQCPSNPNRFQKTQSDALKRPGTARMLRPGAIGKVVPEKEVALPNGKTQQIPAHTEYADSDYMEVSQLSFIPVSYAVNGVVSWRGGSLNMAGLNSVAQLVLVGESVRDDAMMPMPLSENEFARGRALFAGHFQMADFLKWRSGQTTAPQNGAAPDDENAPLFAALTNVLFADGHVKAMRPTETLPNWYNAPVNERTANALARRLYGAESFYTAWLQNAAEGTEESDAPENPAPAKKKAPNEKPAK